MTVAGSTLKELWNVTTVAVNSTGRQIQIFYSVCVGAPS